MHYLSPTQWLTDRLNIAVARLSECSKAGNLQTIAPPLVVDPKELGLIATPLPLKLIRSGRGDSAANVIDAAQAIGADLIAQLNQPLQQNQQTWSAPQYSMHSNGWLCAQFSVEALAHWLQTLLSIQPFLQAPAQSVLTKASGYSTDPLQFELQYAHARCCSLLRLGEQAQLIRLEEIDGYLHLTQPDPLPWNSSQGLRLPTSAERQLVSALMEFPTSLSKPIRYAMSHHPIGTQTWVTWPLEDRIFQRHVQWSQLFESFYRECRIIGIQADSRELAQTRLGLVLLLKNVLKFWLQSALNLEAPCWL